MKLVPAACLLVGAMVGCGQLVQLDAYSLAEDASVDAGGGTDARVVPGDPRPDGGLDGAGEASALPVPACGSGQVLCQGICVEAADCAGCAGAKLFCAGTRTCVSSCETCVDPRGVRAPIECFACDRSQENPIGSCQPASSSTFCLNGDYSTAYRGDAGAHCDCSGNDVTKCPGAHQVCLHVNTTDWCITCGELNPPGTIQGLPCKSGGSCDINRVDPTCL